jgi:hypothetical protein
MVVNQEVVEPQGEESPVEKKKRRGRKRKANATPQYNDVSAGFVNCSLSYFCLVSSIDRLWGCCVGHIITTAVSRLLF